MFQIHKYHEKLEDTKEVISGSKSKIDRQLNSQKKQDTRTNNNLQKLTYKTKDCVTRTPAKTEGKLRFSRMVSSSSSTTVAAVVYIYIYIAYKLNNQGFSQDFETISHFCRADFFFLNMNRQDYNELNLIIIYF